MKKSLVTLAVAAVLIALASAAALAVLTAYAGEQSGLRHCAKLPAACGPSAAQLGHEGGPR